MFILFLQQSSLTKEISKSENVGAEQQTGSEWEE